MQTKPRPFCEWTSSQTNNRCRFEFDVVLDRSELTRALALVRGMLELCEDMRQAAALEWETAVEWFKWLRYGGCCTQRPSYI